MTNFRSSAIRLILVLPILVAPHIAAADDGISPDPTVVTNSSHLAISKITRDTGRLAENDIPRLFEQFADALSAGMWQESDMLAKKIVEASIELYGFYSKHNATALTNLATLQAANKENGSAIQNFAAAIDIIERLESRLSADLIDALRAMGVAQFKAGDADYARDAWYRALHIRHVNFGPHNFEQVEELQLIASLYAEAGMATEARRTQRRIEYLYNRDADRGDKEILSTL